MDDMPTIHVEINANLMPPRTSLSAILAAIAEHDDATERHLGVSRHAPAAPSPAPRIPVVDALAPNLKWDSWLTAMASAYNGHRAVADYLISRGIIDGEQAIAFHERFDVGNEIVLPERARRDHT